MGTLYVVSMPTGDPEDITFRALRILKEVSLIISTSNSSGARTLLDRHRIDTALSPARSAQALPAFLEQGDVALLLDSRGIGPTGPAYELIRAAIERHSDVVSIPGPSLALAALVASGLPTSSFAYLGDLPLSRPARRELLRAVAEGDDQERTLLMLTPCGRVSEALADLEQVLGERPLAVLSTSPVPAPSEGAAMKLAGACAESVIWRGTTADQVHWQYEPLPASSCILVVGGMHEAVSPWDEARLRDEIRTLLDKGLGTKQISHELAEASGWSRRDVYRLVVEEAESRT